MSEPYAVEAPDSFFEFFVSMPDGHQEQVRRFLDVLRHDPSRRHPGVKRLRGAQSHLWQFMVSQSQGTRLLYRFDDERRVVRIAYLGKHPSWSRTRDDQNPEHY